MEESLIRAQEKTRKMKIGAIALAVFGVAAVVGTLALIKYAPNKPHTQELFLDQDYSQRFDWTMIGGAMIDVAVASDRSGKIYAVGQDKKIYTNTKGAWARL